MQPATLDSPFSAEVTVRHRRYASDDGSFAVVECTTPDGPVTLVGPIAHLEASERAQVSGRWTRSQFGEQVRVETAFPLAPSGDAAVAAYLRKVRHVGERTAARLLDRYGEGALDAIDRDPPAAFREAGLSARRSREAAASWDALRATRELHLLLAPQGLAYLAARVHKHYGDGAHRIVRAEPYELTSVFGVGFPIADRVARGLGIEPDSPARLRAALLHALAEAEKNGSTCLPSGNLLREARRHLGSDLADPELIEDAAADGDVVVLEGGWVYRREIAELEEELAERVGELLATEPAEPLPRAVAREAEGATGLDLTTAQRAAVRAAFEHRLSIITGGPGTGKTATIREIVRLAERGRLRLILAAPTGRAAVRMTEATGFDASTVHSVLGWVPDVGPTRDEDSPLECDLVVVDESSMANLELLVTLLRAIDTGTNVVLVGDADQLAPVGAGKPFADLVAGDSVPTSTLDHIFRQAAGSMIVQGAHAVRAGRAPSFAPAEGMKRDLFLVEHADPVEAREAIVDLVAQRLPSHFEVDPVEGIQVFTPIHRGELGTMALNGALRDALNPDGEKALGGFRLGDKLMLTGRNLHDLGLMNGTVLRLLETHTDEDGGGTLTVRSGDAIFEISDEELDRLRLAYACSVHKGQGIELPVAVVVAHPRAGGWFLRREMLYTAITRATKATVIVGERAAVARAAATVDARHSRFAWRLAAQAGLTEA
ncbi:MAG TPA: AAA family ATPase [Thermoleophilaceae bacterium]